MNLKVSEIAEMCGGRLVGSGENTVTSFYTDSRETTPGKMFVPIRGENTDAHRFIPQVFASGAAATFSEEPLDAPAGDVVYVENTRAALQKVAERYRERFNIPVIGITGSVGKTTTKEMVALAVSAGLKTMKTAGNANSQIGLPMTVLRITPEDEAAVVEMGVSMPGEMARIAKVAKPNIAVMTNIGVSHIEFMKTRENIMKEKFGITDYLPNGSKVFVNGDDDLLSTLKSTPEKQIVRFGLGGEDDGHRRERQRARDGPDGLLSVAVFGLLAVARHRRESQCQQHGNAQEDLFHLRYLDAAFCGTAVVFRFEHNFQFVYKNSRFDNI